MRFYILDDLVGPRSGMPLRVGHAEVLERDGPEEARCVRWCGLHGTPAGEASADDCQKCARLWVEQGTLNDGVQQYPIVDGIPRFVQERDLAVDADTQESFGYEWQHFSQPLSEYEAEIDNYFGIVPAEITRDAVVLDAGCGMGRWARQIAKLPVRRLYAVDFSRAIDTAAATLRADTNVHCVQADICNLPFRHSAIDFTYCLGVLHHLRDPDAGMSSIARVTRGALLVYLYYALDNRPRFHRVLLSWATAMRRVTARLPKPAMHALAWAIATIVYWPFARFARLLNRAGYARIAHEVPLAHYRAYSLKFMAGDAFDRFATPIENRYSREEIAAWMKHYGREAHFSEHTPFWVCLGTPTK